NGTRNPAADRPIAGARLRPRRANPRTKRAWTSGSRKCRHPGSAAWHDLPQPPTGEHTTYLLNGVKRRADRTENKWAFRASVAATLSVSKFAICIASYQLGRSPARQIR